MLSTIVASPAATFFALAMRSGFMPSRMACSRSADNSALLLWCAGTKLATAGRGSGEQKNTNQEIPVEPRVVNHGPFTEGKAS